MRTALVLLTVCTCAALACSTGFVIEASRALNSTLEVVRKSVDSLSQCTRFCSSIANCTHFAFVPSENVFNCQLFSETNPVKTTAGSATVGTKTCLEKICEKRSFAYEKFRGRALVNSSFIIKTFSISATECLSQCQKDSTCRAALHNRDTSLCQLSRVSLNSVYNPRLYFQQNKAVDLYENNCVDYSMSSSACTFMRVTGGGLKSVSDQIVQNVGGVEECEQMCLVRSRIADPCRSYTFDNSTSQCFLMWASARMIGRSPLENMIPNLFHGDLDDCVNFSLKCRDKNLEVRASSMRMFVGKMMTKKSKKVVCQENFEGDYSFSSKFDFKKCGLDTMNSTYRGMVHVKEGSTSLVTIRDKMLQVNCHMHKSAPPEDQSLSIQMNVRDNNETSSMSAFSSDNPKFSLKILDMASSSEPETVRIGDHGWLLISVKNAAEDFTVTSLVARDVVGGRVLRIIDEDGCVLRRDIVKEIRKTDNYVKLKISFSGFRRQTEVVYHAMVETCTVGCMPKCNDDLLMAEESVESPRLSLELPRHRMVRRSIAGEPRQLELTSDVYKVHGHKLTLLNPPKMFDVSKSEFQFNEHGEFHDGDVMVVKHASSTWTGIRHCLVDDVTCLLTVVLGAIQMFLMLSCVLIMYCYYQQWRFYRALNRPVENPNVQYYRPGSPKPQVTPEHS